MANNLSFLIYLSWSVPAPRKPFWVAQQRPLPKGSQYLVSIFFFFCNSKASAVPSWRNHSLCTDQGQGHRKVLNINIPRGLLSVSAKPWVTTLEGYWWPRGQNGKKGGCTALPWADRLIWLASHFGPGCFLWKILVMEFYKLFKKKKV